MLHRAKVLEQLKNAEHHMFRDISSELKEAYRVWQRVAHDNTFKDKVGVVATELALAVWYDQLADVTPVHPYNEPYVVAGVDGSQIFPDRHQGSSCFLINIGTVCLQYRKQAYAKLDSQPYVFTGNEVESERFFSGDTTPDGISCRRHTLELRHGCAIMQAIGKRDIPQLLLLDGSLLFWHLATKPAEIQHYFAAQYMIVLEELYQQSHLVAGYISLPHSKELVGLIRFAHVGYDAVAFKNVTMFDVLLDKHVVQFYVKNGYRTGVFKSNAPIASLYPDHLRPYFFYVRNQKEIFRVEIPAWIALDMEKVDTVAALIADQSEKGQGYPISLAEAHEQAVVKGPDREFFYHIVQKLSIEQKRTLVPSQKSLKKRAMSI